MTHPTGDALRAAGSGEDLAALSEAEAHASRALTEAGDEASDWLYHQDHRARWAYVSALMNRHRSGALLDLRSDAGRAVVTLARLGQAHCLSGAESPEADEAYTACTEANTDGVTAALALLDAMKEEPHGG